MCQCRTNADTTVVVCDFCANQIMMVLLDLLPEQDKAQIEPPTVLTAGEHRGMLSLVNGWLDELEVATR